MICNLDNINNIIKREGLVVMVVSYGGCASNTLINALEKNIKSFISMAKRGGGYWDVNQQKMSNSKNTHLSNENLINLMINQFNSWTNIRRDNVLIVKTCELFENSIVDKLEKFLKKKLYNFPISYNTPKTNIENINEYNEYNELFKKYKFEIDKINNFIIN